MVTRVAHKHWIGQQSGRNRKADKSPASEAH